MRQGGGGEGGGEGCKPGLFSAETGSLARGPTASTRASATPAAAPTRTRAASVAAAASGTFRVVSTGAGRTETAAIGTAHRSSPALRYRPLVVRFALDDIDAVLRAAGLGGDEDGAFTSLGRPHRHLDSLARVFQFVELDERARFLQPS